MGSTLVLARGDMRVTRQGNLYRFYLRRPPTGGGRRPGKRGRISGFSASSRRRLLRLLAVVKWRGALMVTLTSRYDPTYANLRAFYKRLSRRYGKLTLIWKMELQQRGVVHYHLIIPSMRYIPHAYIKRTWSEIVGSESVVWVQRVSSRTLAALYVSKYIAKPVASGAGTEAEPSTADAGDAYLDSTIISGHRYWGVLGRRYLRYYTERELPISAVPSGLLSVFVRLESLLRADGIYPSRLSFVWWWT